MPTRVRFVVNKVTGEVEEFLIDDQDRNLPEDEHDRIALGIGALIARNPALVIAPRAGLARTPEAAPAAASEDAEDQRRPDQAASEIPG